MMTSPTLTGKVHPMNYTLHRGNDTFNLTIEFDYYPPTQTRSGDEEDVDITSITDQSGNRFQTTKKERMAIADACIEKVRQDQVEARIDHYAYLDNER